MSGLGRQRPLSSLSREGPLTGAKRAFQLLTITILKDRCPPEAAGRDWKSAYFLGMIHRWS